ncbi:thermonuclease family protein [Desulfovibrio sp. TomC]|uniref:thermonuclease family protein n=1 Tax=Desulfovibrio sp. TomC TaxID=1562888 RepID=UPI0012E1D53D|nr:hypothetical protein [Desulfovibrio sp. TomC]
MIMIRSFAFLLVFALLPIPSLATDSWQGKVVNVLDGTALDIAKPDGQIERIKLYAVIAPVPGNPLGDDARRRTTSWCYQWGDVAEVLPVYQEPTGQVVARVIVGQEDLAGVLAKACLASINMRTCRKRETVECVSWHAWELQCRDEQKGLWANKAQ